MENILSNVKSLIAPLFILATSVLGGAHPVEVKSNQPIEIVNTVKASSYPFPTVMPYPSPELATHKIESERTEKSEITQEELNEFVRKARAMGAPESEIENYIIKYFTISPSYQRDPPQQVIIYQNTTTLDDNSCQKELLQYQSCLSKYNNELLQYQNCILQGKQFGCFEPLKYCDSQLPRRCR